jgi:hypothetical protein
MKRSLIFCAGLPLAMSFAAAAEEITVSGCAAVGAEAQCIILETGGKTYNITAAQPTPMPGTYGTVTGTLSDRVSACQEGQVVEPATWTVDPGTQCPIKTSQ